MWGEESKEPPTICNFPLSPVPLWSAMAVGAGIPTNNLDRADLSTEVRGLSLWGMGWPRSSFQNILSLQAEMKSLMLSLVSPEAGLLFFFLARSLCHGTGAFLEPPIMAAVVAAPPRALAVQ